MRLSSESELVSLAGALGAQDVPKQSASELRLLADAAEASPTDVEVLRRRIRDGEDPLGDAFTTLRSPVARRPLGATYTPMSIVNAMVDWAAKHGEPQRVVDVGVGSGRFLLAAGKRFPDSSLIGVEVDPIAALTARANLAAAGLAERAEVILNDYRSLALPRIDGRTLFIGNPPYVRHHLIGTDWKNWLAREARSRSLTVSQLAGLHVHFYLATLLYARPGDFGAFITAAEWLDVNYGQLVRQMFVNGLGGQSILLIDPSARPFPDAATTAAIATFQIGTTSEHVFLRRVRKLKDVPPIGIGNPVHRERLASETRWTYLSRTPREVPAGYVDLGEICRVHRGQVTGNNRIWIAGSHSRGLPDSVLFPSVTRARELFITNGRLESDVALRCIVDLPAELDVLDTAERTEVEKFLGWARRMGADRGYIAQHRRAWWSVGLRPPPPIMATYMARRPPAFVQNLAAARYINIAHGLYPRAPLSVAAIARLAKYLADNAASARGRVYAGGLMKFEPREMERIVVPGPELLADIDAV